LEVKILIFVFLFFNVINSTCIAKELNFCLSCHRGHYFTYKGCNKCHRGILLSKRKDIAHFRLIPGKFSYFRFSNSLIIKQGVALIRDEGCRRCHRILGKGNILATSLDSLPKDIDVTELVLYLKNPPFFMPNFRFSGDEIVALVNVILRGVFLYNEKNKLNFYVVHFDKRKIDDSFTTYCGRCHMALTRRLGGIGKGQIGPNLSGIFTKYYPFKKIIFSEEKLGEWIRNPRELDKGALMPPVDIPLKTICNIITILKN